MEFRNASFNQYGTIDCEINNPDFGWIPFTADPNDVYPAGPEVFEAAKNTATPYVPPPTPPEPTPEEIYIQELAEAQANRQAAFQREADPLFFKWQAGEGTEEDWQAKRQEIRERYPYPEPN
jgi:hypothetical protein